MYTLFIVLIVLASLLMIFIVLIQESKGGGLASNFSSTNSIMGVRKTTNFVEKATWGLAGAMVVFSIVCAYTAPKAVTEESVLENAAAQQQSTNAANTQGFGAAQAPAQGAQAPAAQGSQAPAQGAPATPAK
ncbi:MAG TPA: preprotein translocase subunit SecG [Prevotella sp.]|nr:preprotein translocase subunit SecG [Prevotella sp.]